MLLRSIRRMYGLCFEGQRGWTHRFLLVIWLLLLAAAPPKAYGYFLGDTKAVLNGCEDHWTLQDRAAMPLLLQMTVCVDIRVIVPGAWVAFTYSSVHAARPELGLEGDDEALYGWLLRVRHRFPLRLPPTHWHRVCLRRDVQHNSFSLEVDGKMVAERTVIAQAIPPSGSLWLGCHPRDQQPGAVLGKVELYLFRMWPDLGNHGFCEDGTVIGWNAQYWGLTSPKARQRDPYLLCDRRRFRRGARSYRSVTNAITPDFGRSFAASPEVPLTPTTSSPAFATPATHMSNQTSQVTGVPLVNCDISQLCSNRTAYYWMSISVEAKGSKTEEDVHNLVSDAFGCHGGSDNAAHIDFCQDDRQLQVVQVNCKDKSKIRETTCDVLLLLSHAVSVCELRSAGVSALQQAGDQQLQARIVGEVERVGRDLCKDVVPSSGGFVRCTSTSSLDDFCRADKQPELTCALIEPNSDPAPQPKTESCGWEEPRFCDCTAFCNSASQFFAFRININEASVNVDLLKILFSGYRISSACNMLSGSMCQDSEILKYYQGAHVECHGTPQRLYSCMVILEMSGPVNSCSLNNILQQLIDGSDGITSERLLTRMVICGSPGLPVRTLLTSNLTWVSTDLLTSDVCQPDPTLLQCEANETFAVLLTDSCPPTTQQSTMQPSTLTNINITTTPKASQPSVANTTGQTYTTVENVTAAQQKNFSQGTSQPETTTPLTAINSTQFSAQQPDQQTSTPNMTVTPTLSDNTTLLTPSEYTKLQNTTTSHQIATESIKSPANSTQQITTSAPLDSTLNTTTLSPNYTTEYNVNRATPFTPTEYNVPTSSSYENQHNSTITMANTTSSTSTPSENYTGVYNVTTATPSYTVSDTFTTEYNVTIEENNIHNGTTTTSNTTFGTITTSPNHTTVYNLTITTKNYTTVSNNRTTEYNVTTVVDNRAQHNSTVTTSNATINTITASPNYTGVYNVSTTVNNYTTEISMTTAANRNQHNSTVTTSNITVNTITNSPNYTVVYNVTTGTNNYTIEYNVTTADNRYQHNSTATTSNTTINAVTTSPNYTVVYNVTAVANNYTTEYNVTTAANGNQHNSTVTTSNTITASPNYTVVYNVTTGTNNYTAEYNVTTIANNYTTEYNVTTADNRFQHNGTATASNTTVNAVTTSPNYTVEYNVTTGTNNYTTEYNVTTADNRYQHNSTATTNTATINTVTTSPNYTVVYNVTAVANNYTTEYNVTTANTRYEHNSTATSNTTINVVTTSPNYTIVYNVTTGTNNYTIEYNVTTAANNYTTEYNVTTADNRYQHNSTATSNTTTNAITTSPNYTVVYNVTTVANNYTTEYNITTASFNYTKANNLTTATRNYTTAYNNYTTDYNITTVDNNSTNRNNSVTNNTTFTPSPIYNITTADTFTPSPNHTEMVNIATTTSNYTTASNNYTTYYNVTTADKPHNGTITSNATVSTFTHSHNYTLVNNVTTVSSNYTTAKNITTTMASQNTTAPDNVTTAPYNTSTTATQVVNTTTSTKNSTIASMTSTVNVTKSTVAQLNNQTGNHTTARVTYDVTTTTDKNYTNSTTAATGVSPIFNHNETTEINVNLSSTATSLTTDFNLTTSGPGVNLTTEHGPLPTQISTTPSEVPMNSSTTTLLNNMSTTTKPATETTPTTTAETTKSQEAQQEQANQLLAQSQDASQLNSSQVAQLTGQLVKLLDGPTVSQEVGQKAVNIISNLMDGNPQALSASANRLIQVVDDLGLKLAVAGDSEIVSSNSLVLAVRTVDGTNFPTTSVDIFNTNNVQLHALRRSRSKRSGSALGSVFLPSSLTAGLTPEQQQQASRVQFTFYTKSSLFQDASLNNQTLLSPVLGSSVANLSISNLSEDIQFTIRNINPVHANYTASCVFWDFSLNGGGGGWSSAGCAVVNATPEETICSCNHLTSFAILLDLSREGLLDRQHAQILTFITYIGCGISAIFLAVTLLTYLSFEKLLRDIPAKILVQLCMSLLFLNLVFLLDGWLALYPAIGLCISTAFFLHYFLLTSFTWAGLEALHMYLSVIQVFTPYLSRYMLKFSLMGWGIPLFVVIVVISVDKDNYGLVTYGKYTDGTSDDFCWLRNDIAFYVGVVAYFILIFSLCLLVFIMVMVQLARIKRQNPQNQSPNRGVLTDLRSIAGLIILLGLTWGFALFAWGPLYIPFVYLFSIFNSLQGFLIFVFHCAVKENVRRQWRTYLCCGKLRLAENSEWSRTATQNNRNTSVATATTSAPRLTSRSSSVISDGTNSSGSVFADSGISEGSSSDVILNEINRRNLSL